MKKTGEITAAESRKTPISLQKNWVPWEFFKIPMLTATLKSNFLLSSGKPNLPKGVTLLAGQSFGGAGGALREGDSSRKSGTKHESVLIDEVLETLDLHDGEIVLDATAGQGGHSEALLHNAKVRLIALDADAAAAAIARQRLQPFGERANVVEANFRDVHAVLKERGIDRVDRALFDLGWNRGQLSQGKGFSFQNDEPLNMSYGQEPVSGFTAADILNTWSEEAVANVLFGYGGEHYARRIARTVAEARLRAPIATTKQFVAIVERSVPAGYRRGRVHAATKSFQALRIAVNDEYGSIERGLRGAWEMLGPGGRLAVISFHSGEDRLVKKLFLELAESGGTIMTKKPIMAGRDEILRNPAARSAKLRVILRLTSSS
jgi:16S rRNA (cytosine1402-N4)-methyltransferase